MKKSMTMLTTPIKLRQQVICEHIAILLSDHGYFAVPDDIWWAWGEVTERFAFGLYSDDIDKLSDEELFSHIRSELVVRQ